MNRLRRILWALEDNATLIVGTLIVSMFWGSLIYLIIAGEFK